MKKPKLHWNGVLYWYEGGQPATDKDAADALLILDAVRGGPKSASTLMEIIDSHSNSLIWRMQSQGLLEFEESWDVARVYKPFEHLRKAGYRLSKAAKEHAGD